MESRTRDTFRLGLEPSAIIARQTFAAVEIRLGEGGVSIFGTGNSIGLDRRAERAEISGYQINKDHTVTKVLVNRERRLENPQFLPGKRQETSGR